MKTKRIVCLIDMDCFYVQCEQRLQPDKWLKPCAVAQYNSWKGGGLIAVNYEARASGIKRGMRGDDATKLCSDLHVFSVNEKNGKADLTRYRDASDEVFNAIGEFIGQLDNEVNQNSCVVLEKASVDEAYLDFTNYFDSKDIVLPDVEELGQYNTKLEMNGITIKDWFDSFNSETFNDNARLLMGAILVGKIRKHIFETTQFKCSAGISHNKMLSKLSCSINKPNAQTILPMEGVAKFFERVNITDVRMLGGKLGRRIVETFAIRTMKELNQLDVSILTNIVDDKTANWLHVYSSGIDDDTVIHRRISKSIGCGKNFTGKNALVKLQDVLHWIEILCQELHTRMENDRVQNKRIAKSIIVGYHTAAKGHNSKSHNLDILNGYPKPETISNDIMKSVFANLENFDPIVNLSMAATKFVDESELDLNKTSKIDNFFNKIDRSSHIEKSDETMSSKPKQRKIENVNIAYYFNKLYNLNRQQNMELDNEDNSNDYSDQITYTNNEIEDIKKTFFFRKLIELYDDSDEEE